MIDFLNRSKNKCSNTITINKTSNSNVKSGKNDKNRTITNEYSIEKLLMIPTK